MNENPHIIWIDDEPSHLEGEMYELEVCRIPYRTFNHPIEALHWFRANVDAVQKARAIVVDVLMPSRGIREFVSEDGTPVGIMFLKILQSENFIDWEQLKPKVALYTRLPEGNSLTTARSFAQSEGIELLKKTVDSRIAVQIMEMFDLE